MGSDAAASLHCGVCRASSEARRHKHAVATYEDSMAVTADRPPRHNGAGP